MNSAASEDCLRKTIDAIGVLLVGKGFRRLTEVFYPSDKYNAHVWARTKPWKIEKVQILSPKKHLDHVMGNLEVSIPLQIMPDTLETPIDGMSLQSVLDRRTSFYFPGFLLGFRAQSFAGSTASKVAQALSWFNEFDTPQKAIARLESGESNHSQPGAKYFNEIVGYLRSVKV